MIEYLIKFFAISLVSYLSCSLLIKYCLNYKVNRFWLLFCLCFSVFIPLISLQVDANNIIGKLSYEQLIEPNYVYNSKGVEQNSETFLEVSEISFKFIVGAIYISIALFLFLRFCVNIRSLLQKRFYAEQLNYKEHIVYGLNENVKPFTFLNFIFINKNDWLTHPNKEELINHEIYHKNLKHSLDILFIELLKVIFWFNPVLYFYKTLIQINHEYEVDATIILNGFDAKSYTHMIIDYTFIPKTGYNKLSSGFSHSFIKKRITMISKLKKNRTSFKQSLFMSFLIVILFLSSAFTIDNSENYNRLTNDKPGYFFAEKLTYSQENQKLYLKGKNIKISFQNNDISGKGSFTFLGKVDYLQINSKKVVPGTTLQITGRKCIIKQINDHDILSGLGLNNKAKAFEITITEE